MFICLTTLFIVITTIIYFIKGHINTNDIDFTKLGTYGDFVGGSLGTILSIVAVILVYRTYISQKEELSMSRNLLEQQQFENTFFNMLKVHQDLKNGISFNTENQIFREYLPIGIEGARITENGQEVIGKHFFNIASLDFAKLFKYSPNDKLNYNIDSETVKKIESYGFGTTYIEPTYKDDIKDIKFKYDIFFENYASYLGDYFRNLYHILKFISSKKNEELNRIKNNSSINKIENKYKQYSDILQSQMNFSELRLCYYNSFKFKKLRSLIREFDFLENLHSSNLLSEDHLKFKSLGKIKTI